MRDLTVVFLHLLKTVARLAVLAALIVRKWTYPSKRSGRHGVLAEIQRLVETFYTVFVIDLASRRVQIVGSTPHPNDLFMRQVGRTLTATDGLLSDHRVLICDRDRKWSRGVPRLLAEAGVLLQQAWHEARRDQAAHRIVRKR